jgi:DNA-binding NarL/FixJ family response regulator
LRCRLMSRTTTKDLFCASIMKLDKVKLAVRNNRTLNIGTSLFIAEDEWRLVTMFADGERISEALRIGATVFLVKSSEPNQMPKVLGDGHHHGAIMPTMELHKIKRFRLTRISSGKLESLSPREAEVFELLTLGLFYAEIGEKLNIGMETVRTHVKRICSKMHVRNRVEAVAKCKTKAQWSEISSSVLKKQVNYVL